MNLRPSSWYGPATLAPQEASSQYGLGNSFTNNLITIGHSNANVITFVSASTSKAGDLENGSLDNYAPAYNSNNNNQHLCSAFIRNGNMPSAFSSVPAGMLSLAELGCIHRGKRWQTLNLCYYHDVTGSPTAGGGDYSLGDGNILDQVKLTSNTSVYGKVNLNTNVQRVLQALFANLFLSSTGNNNDSSAGVSRYYNPTTLRTGTSYGQYLALTDAATMASSFISGRGAVGDGTLKTRVQALGNSTLRNLLCRNLVGPKCVNEQFLCDFINLTKAEPDQTTMVIIAQAIKDVGIPCLSTGLPASAGGVTIYKDWGGSGAYASAGATSAGQVAAGYVDPSGVYSGLPVPNVWPAATISNCRKGVYENGADVITAERKFYITLSYDSKNCKWRIISIQPCIN